LSIAVNAAFAGTETLWTILYSTELLNTLTIIFAGDAVILDIFKLLILTTYPLEAEFATISAALVPTAWTAVFPRILVTFTIFGLAIF